MPTPNHNTPRESLAVFDALHDAEYSIDQLDPAHQQSASKFLSLLQLLDPLKQHATPDASLVDATLLRCLGNRRTTSTLTGDDAKAIDSLVEHEWDQNVIPAGFTARATRVTRLLSILDAPADVTEADIAQRTFQRVRTHAAVSAQRELFEVNTLRTGGLPMRDLAAIAAMVLLACSILFPTISTAQHNARLQACNNSLANAGVAFSLYTRDHLGQLPSTPAAAQAQQPGQTWWDVGQSQHSHSADLFMLASLGYADQHDLACVGNDRAVVNLDLHKHQDWRSLEEVSYSYQLFPASVRVVRFAVPAQTVLLADRSPIVARSQLGEYISTKARSYNHSGRGQNILAADRSVLWLESPVTPWGDNIWLPAAYEHQEVIMLLGNEMPTIWGDIFVGP